MDKKTFFWIILGLAVGLPLINFMVGFSEDHDARIVINRAIEFGARGYGPNRSWGFPLYELFIYPIIFYFGNFWAKIFSFLLYVFSALFFYRLLFYLLKDSTKAFLGTLCYILHPLALISGNSIAETSEVILFSLLAIYSYFKFIEEEKSKYILWMAGLTGLTVAIRPDYLLLALALALTLLVFDRQKSQKWVLFSIPIFLAVSVGIFLVTYGVKHYQNMPLYFLYDTSLKRKIPRAALGYLALWGVPAFVLLSAYLLIKRPFLQNIKRALFQSRIGFLFCATFFLFTCRFVATPDKLEYVWIVYLLSIILLLSFVRSKIFIYLFILAVAVPNVFQIHFFERIGTELHFNIGISPGAIAQDRSERLKHEYMHYGDYEAVIKEAAMKKFKCDDYAYYLTAETGPNYCMIVHRERLRFWNPDRLQKDLDRNEIFKKRIIVFDMPDHRAWRQFIKFAPWKRLTLDDFELYSGS